MSRCIQRLSTAYSFIQIIRATSDVLLMIFVLTRFPVANELQVYGLSSILHGKTPATGKQEAHNGPNCRPSDYVICMMSTHKLVQELPARCFQAFQKISENNNSLVCAVLFTQKLLLPNCRYLAVDDDIDGF